MGWKFWEDDEQDHSALKIAAHEERVKKLEEELRTLGEERFKLKQQVEDLGIKHKVEDEQMRHLVKMKDEKREMEYQRKEMDSDRKRETDIGKVKDLYRDKLEVFLKEQVTNLRGMYDEILKRLPDVNVKLKGNV